MTPDEFRNEPTVDFNLPQNRRKQERWPQQSRLGCEYNLSSGRLKSEKKFESLNPERNLR